MIPDAAGIYTEAEPPLAYDPALEAYRDTEGYAYNPALDAWKKVWPDGEKPLIPTMTSYADMTNNGVGNASVDSENKGGGGYQYFSWSAFNSGDNDCWVSKYTANEHYAAFVFYEMTRVKRVEVRFRSTPANIYQPIAHIQYTEDGSTWADLWEGRTNDGTEGSDKTISTDLNKTIKGVRIYTPAGYSGTYDQKYLGAYYIQCWQ